MLIKELLTETVADDRIIVDAARAVADFIVNNYAVHMYPGMFGSSRSQYHPPSAYAQQVKFSARNLRNIDDPVYQRLGETQVRIGPIEGGQQAMAGRIGKDFAILLNYKKFDGYGKDITELHPWLVETLSHEMRHILDLIKQDAHGKNLDFATAKYYQKPHLEDEPDSTQNEINAYFTQILHQVESDLKNNNITDVNQALKFAQESLQDSQLAEVIFGGWNNSNPVLRRLSARMAQFVHSLYKQ